MPWFPWLPWPWPWFSGIAKFTQKKENISLALNKFSLALNRFSLALSIKYYFGTKTVLVATNAENDPIHIELRTKCKKFKQIEKMS